MQGVRYYFNSSNGNMEIKKCSNSMHSSKAHFHNEVSIGLVESGGCKTEIYGKAYELTEKTILIIPPTLAHKCNPYNYKEWKFKMLYINEDWFKNAFRNDRLEIKFSYIKMNERMFNDVIELFDNLEKNAMNLENEPKLLKYVSTLTNIGDKSYEKENNINLNFKKINEIKEYLDESYLNEITLDDLSKISGISKYYLIRQFEESQGLSPHKYLTNLRINHAKNLLRNEDNFADIALESGFYDQSHFIKYFKEYTGVTPTKYRSYVT